MNIVCKFCGFIMKNPQIKWKYKLLGTIHVYSITCPLCYGETEFECPDALPDKYSKYLV